MKKKEKKKTKTAAGTFALSFLFSAIVALVLAIDVFGEDGLQYMDAAFQVYAKVLIAAAFLIQLIPFIYLKKCNYTVDELQKLSIRGKKVVSTINLIGFVLPLLMLLQLENSLALCMSIQGKLFPPSMRPDLWSLQLPMLCYTVAFSVLWVFVLCAFGAFWQHHSDNGKLNGSMPPQYILLGSLGLLAVFWLSSMATQYLWWKIYGIYNEASSVSRSVHIASMLLAAFVIVLVFLFVPKKDSSQMQNIAPQTDEYGRTKTTYLLSAEDLYFLFDGGKFDFLQEIPVSPDNIEQKKKDFCARNAEKQYADSNGIPCSELADMVAVIRNCDFSILRPSQALLGARYTDGFYGKSEQQAVMVHRASGGKCELTSIPDTETVEKMLSQVFQFGDIHKATKSISLNLEAEQGDALLAAIEDNNMSIISDYASKADISADELTALIKNIKRSKIQMEINRLQPEEGGILLNIDANSGAAMRFVASPKGNMLCFETVDTEHLFEFVTDYKGR